VRAAATQHELDAVFVKLAEAEQRAAAADAHARELDLELRELENRTAEQSTGVSERDSQLAGAAARIEELEREVAQAENVRQFAAATEREIAQLQRELRDARKQMEQMGRDQLMRGDSTDGETTGKRPPIVPYDPEVTAQADLDKYEPVIAKSKEAIERAARLERADADLRRKLAETEAKLRAAMEIASRVDQDVGRTTTSMPAAMAEPMLVLEESIDSLRAEMRAAADEAAEMTPTPSVQAIAAAVGSAREHLDRAKAAMRALVALIEP
jgi:chromosome segregation ATPase